jgi:hypothetical protein
MRLICYMFFMKSGKSLATNGPQGQRRQALVTLRMLPRAARSSRVADLSRRRTLAAQRGLSVEVGNSGIRDRELSEIAD